MIKGIGTDIIEISRIEKAVQSEHFKKRVFTDKELKEIASKHKQVESLAGLFAAKEAVSKALGTGFRNFGPRDIEIITDKLGKPGVILKCEARVLAHRLGVESIHLTISHCKAYAVAYALIEGDETNEVNGTRANEAD